MSHLEYLLFNLLVLAGPLAMSFEPHVRYLRRWPAALGAALIMLIPFAVWDILVTGRHWWFNPLYTSGTFIGPLPAGEWLFFITVPFASLFVWEVLRYYRPQQHQLRRPENTILAGTAAARVMPDQPGGWSRHNRWSWRRPDPALLLWLLLPLAWWLQQRGREYTALVLLVFWLVAQADLYLGGRILRRPQVWPYAAVLAGLMLLFNGYLTARPVVLYDPAYQLDWRVITIPVEDFLYGYSLLLGSTSIYEKWRSENE